MNLLRGYASLFHRFRHEDFVGFAERHERLYADARRRGDHTEVVDSFYRLMAKVIEVAYGPSWHFCPPERDGQSREQATHALHLRLAADAGIVAGTRGLDLGCGVGGALVDVARSCGADMTGITLAANEVEAANASARELGLAHRCRAVQGDAQAMPFPDESFDGIFALYSLKYLPRLDRVFTEVERVLRPGGRFVVYDIVKTDRYDEGEPQHARIVHGFEYACGMPDLHTVDGMAATSARAGLAEILRTDLSGRHPWYFYFERTPLLPWLVGSPAISQLVHSLERIHLLPRGFAHFNDVFASGIVHSLLEGGRLGIISGSALLVLRKPGLHAV